MRASFTRLASNHSNPIIARAVSQILLVRSAYSAEVIHMAVDLLLREGRINQLRLPHRILTGPMEKSMANRDGSFTARYTDYIVERARGGAGMITVESTYVDTRGMGHLYQVGCHGDHVIPALKRMAEAAHREGAKVGLELYMGGRETPSYMSQRQPIAPSVVKCNVLNPVPTPREMTLDDIQQVIGIFAAAARRVVEAGLDMILLHGAHGYLLCSFLSPFTNKRTDRYGGSLENRARFPLEVLAAMRAVTGPSFAIAYRMSAEEYIPGGLTIDQTVEFSKMLADAKIDLIDVSGGLYESARMIMQGPGSPKGGFVKNAAAIKRAVGDKTKVSSTQRLSDPDFANEVLRTEGLDFVTLGRAFHADPHYVRKLKENRRDEIIPCIACHECVNLLEANLAAGCAANPHSAFERKYQVRPVQKRARIVIVGGGPAGMHAARILAEQGNAVTLHEATGELGGQMRYSSRVAPDYGDLVKYLSRQMQRLKVDLNLNSRVTLQTLRSLQSDAIVIATGAGPGLNFWPVRGKPTLLNLFAAMDRPVDQWKGQRVVIAGGDSESCFLAIYAARNGAAEVHVIEPSATFSYNKMSPARELLMMIAEELPNVKLRPETTVEEIGEGYVNIQRHGAHERLDNIAMFVIGGRTANNALYEQLRAEAPGLELYNIGDSVEPREVYAASHEAAEVAETIRQVHSAG
jgi:2,4-dienoyl-CoA reductase-like NADH-dependent reductase (Old Yellow Enzyme family)/thioredoxin reductase